MRRKIQIVSVKFGDLGHPTGTLRMINDEAGNIDYEECGHGQTIVLVPGSCSTGAAWNPVVAAFHGQYHCVTTSLLGYGATAERRTSQDASILHEVDVIERVLRQAGSPVHLVGHSFGGLVALAVALRGHAPLASLTILEAPAAEILRACGEEQHYRAFRQMTDAYFADFEGNNKEAIAAMIDFYGGVGTFASWPPRVRAYAIETTAVNILDWKSAYGFPLQPTDLGAVNLPTLISYGSMSHPAARRANFLLGEFMDPADVVPINGAAHFMIATHAKEVGRLIVEHIGRSGNSC